MSDHQALVHVSVKHEYFSNQQATAIGEYRPTDFTLDWLKQAGLTFRANAQGFHICLEAHKKELF